MFCFLLLGTSFVLELLVLLLLPIALIVLAGMLGMLTCSVMRSDGFISIVFSVLIDRYRLLGLALASLYTCRVAMGCSRADSTTLRVLPGLFVASSLAC